MVSKNGEYIGFYVYRRSWLLWSPVIGCLRFTKFCWVGKYLPVNIMKPTNSPTQGQPNPRKIGVLKVAFGPLFPTEIFFFRGLGLILYRKKVLQTQPNQILRKHPTMWPDHSPCAEKRSSTPHIWSHQTASCADRITKNTPIKSTVCTLVD